MTYEAPYEYLGNINGFTVIADRNMVDTKSVTVKRKWWERIFYKPFTPTKTVTITVPSDNLIVLEDTTTIICHPDMYDSIKDKYEQ